MPVRLNLCLPVPEPWSWFARQASRELVPRGNAIDLAVCVPHVTIFMASFPEDAVEGAVEVLRAIAAEGHAFDAGVGSIVLSGGYVFLEVELAPQLRHLHRLVLAALPPLRRGLRVESERLRVAERSPELLPALDRYGSARVAEHYQPHLTLGKLPDAVSPPEVIVRRPEGSIAFGSLALGQGGEHGVVKRILAHAALTPRA